MKNQLSGFLQYVKKGERIVIKDRSVPVARIVPFRHGSKWQHEATLVASGALRMPEEEMDCDLFFRSPSGEISHRTAVDAAVESRGDR